MKEPTVRTASTPGRKPYKPTEEQKRNVCIWMAARVSKAEISRKLGIDEKTLDKYYPDELRFGASRIDGEHLIALHNKIIMEGNVAAFEAFQKLKRIGMMPADLQTIISESEPKAPAAPKGPKLGKKELQKQTAQNPDPSTDLGDWMLRRQNSIN